MKHLLRSLTLGVAVTAFVSPASAQFLGLDNDGLVGGAVGAGIGGVIGSNLAAGDVQDEGTALGAVIGGIAGYAIASGSNGSRYGNYGGHGYSSGYGYAPYSGYSGGHSYGYSQQNYYTGYSNYPAYVPSYPQTMPCGGYSGCSGPQFIPSGQYSSHIIPGPSYTYYETVLPSYTYVQPVQVYQPPVQTITTSSCSAGSTYSSGHYGLAEGETYTGDVLCYSDSPARYDHMGRRIR